jgi:cytochrome c oxidase assembly protein subunit 15
MAYSFNGLATAKLYKFSLFTLIFNILVILWGAYVRASGSGAGCGAHWPLCNGEILPSTDKIQTLVELSHRLTSGIALLLVVLLFFWTRKDFPKKSAPRKYATWSLTFMIIEALIGAALVLLKLVGDNDSSHRAIVVGFHLINSFALLAALTLTWASQKKNGESQESSLKSKAQKSKELRQSPDYKLYFLIFLFALVSCAGAITALGDTLFPAKSLKEGIAQDFLASSHFLIKLRIWHPALAIITSILIWIYCTSNINARENVDTQKPTNSLAWGLSPLHILRALIIAQIIFGFINLLLLAPIWSQIIHLFFACCCWICLVLATTRE